MEQSNFQIKIIRQHWIKDDGKIDREDLCSHGQLFVSIGNDILSDENSGSWTLSVTALYLLRSLTENYEPGQYGSQIVPCCGHFMIPNEDDKNLVEIIGCPEGIDWSINHVGDHIKLISENGETGLMQTSEYKKLVFDFAREVEVFYGNPNEKILPEDPIDKKAFEQFWNEWKKLTEQ